MGEGSQLTGGSWVGAAGVMRQPRAGERAPGVREAGLGPRGSPLGRARPALTFRAISSPAEVLGAAVAEGSAQREAEEVEHPAGSHGLRLGHQLRVVSWRLLHLLLWRIRILPVRTSPRVPGL